MQRIRSWLWRHMPPGWRHRRVMRAAMARRRRWLAYKRTAFIPELCSGPREEHRFRRIIRELEAEERQMWREAIRRATMVAFDARGEAGDG